MTKPELLPDANKANKDELANAIEGTWKLLNKILIIESLIGFDKNEFSTNKIFFCFESICKWLMNVNKKASMIPIKLFNAFKFHKDLSSLIKNTDLGCNSPLNPTFQILEPGSIIILVSVP